MWGKVNQIAISTKLRMTEKANRIAINTKLWICKFAKEENGDFGVGQIAMIIASVVIIGMIVMAVTDRLPTFIDDIWTQITSWLDKIGTGSGTP